MTRTKVKVESTNLTVPAVEYSDGMDAAWSSMGFNLFAEQGATGFRVYNSKGDMLMEFTSQYPGTFKRVS
jgi:hypothetical protein